MAPFMWIDAPFVIAGERGNLPAREFAREEILCFAQDDIRLLCEDPAQATRRVGFARCEPSVERAAPPLSRLGLRGVQQKAIPGEGISPPPGSLSESGNPSAPLLQPPDD